MEKYGPVSTNLSSQVHSRSKNLHRVSTMQSATRQGRTPVLKSGAEWPGNQNCRFVHCALRCVQGPFRR